MRKSVCRSLLRWLPPAASLAAIVVALAADYIGVDADQKWGPFRTALFATGIIGLLLAAGMRAVSALDRRLLNARKRINGLQGFPYKPVGFIRRFPLRPVVSGRFYPLFDHTSQEISSSYHRRERTSPIRLRMQSAAMSLVAAKRHIPLVVLFLAVELLYL